MTIVGYARVSSTGQDLTLQLEKLAGCDKVFKEKRSGVDAGRPALKACLEYLREGDTSSKPGGYSRTMSQPATPTMSRYSNATMTAFPSFLNVSTGDLTLSWPKPLNGSASMSDGDAKQPSFLSQSSRGPLQSSRDHRTRSFAFRVLYSAAAPTLWASPRTFVVGASGCLPLQP
jgi:resolvase-like protein